MRNELNKESCFSGWHRQVLLPVVLRAEHGQEYLPVPPKHQHASCGLLVSCLIALLVAPITLAQAPERELNLLAMGDWGEGKPAQATVADALAKYAKRQKLPIDAMLLAGDNFYVPLADV